VKIPDGNYEKVPEGDYVEARKNTYQGDYWLKIMTSP
jgi:hypothetical protein